MVDATQRELARAGADPPGVVIADAGYWHKPQIEKVVDRGIQVLIPPDSGLRKTPRPGWEGGLYAFMRRVLATDHSGLATQSEMLPSPDYCIGRRGRVPSDRA
jgi:hypothetical protein